MNTQDKTNVVLTQDQKVKYVEKSILCGLIKWWVQVSAQTIGNTLFIETDERIDSVILNGERLANIKIEGFTTHH